MKLENTFTVAVPRDTAWDVLLDVERIAPCMPGATLTGQDGDNFSGTVKVKVGPINLTYGGTATFLRRDKEEGVAVIEASGKETRGTGTAKATITCRLSESDGSTRVVVDTTLAITGKPAQFGRGVLADVSSKLVDQFAACLAADITTQGESDARVGADAGADAAAAGVPVTGAAPDAAAPDEAAPDEASTTQPIATSAVRPQAATTSGGGGLTGVSSTAGSAAPTGSTGSTGGEGSAAAAGPRPLTPRPPAEPIDLLGTAGMPVLKRFGPPAGGLVLLVLLLVRWWRRR